VLGRLRNQQDFDRIRAKQLLITSRHKRLRVAADGEVELMHTPLRYRIRPGALQVLVPRPNATRSDRA
jgi:diacylglycerol kinase family enzyme